MIDLKCNIVLWLKSYLQIQVKWYTWESVVQIKQQIYTEEPQSPIWNVTMWVSLFLRRILEGKPKWVIWIWKRWLGDATELLTSISSFNLNYLAVRFIAVPPPPWVFKYLFLSEWSFVPWNIRQSYCLKRQSGQISELIKLNISLSVCLVQPYPVVSCHNTRVLTSHLPPSHTSAKSPVIQLNICRCWLELFIITRREYFRIWWEYIMSITTAWRLSHISKIVIICKHFSCISLSNLVSGSENDVDTSSPCYAGHPAQHYLDRSLQLLEPHLHSY